MSTLFLFGAGASRWSGECDPHPPADGAGLFSALQENGGVAASITGDLVERFKSDFELGMAEFFKTRSSEVAAFTREMARYFVPFASGSGNYYRALIAFLTENRHQFILASTNYDLLIEDAASRLGFDIHYGTEQVANCIRVLKIHGSCNFLPDLGTNTVTGFKSEDTKEAILVADARVVNKATALYYSKRDISGFAPAMAMYAKGKQVLFCPDFVKRQLVAFQDALKSASQIYVVGLRVNVEDEHIWMPLASTKGDLFWVGKERDQFENWASAQKREHAYWLTSTFEDAAKKIMESLKVEQLLRAAHK